MRRGLDISGERELRNALSDARVFFWAAALFSVVVNLLILTGPLYMLQVYDRVLGSQSLPTLVSLSGIAAFLFGIMGVLDYARGRIVARAGVQLQARLDTRVFSAALRQTKSGTSEDGPRALHALESLQRSFASPALLALLDLPFTPVFLMGIFLMHPLLGLLSLGGGAVLILLTFGNRALSHRPLTQAAQASQAADGMAQSFATGASTIRALGMEADALSRWNSARTPALRHSLKAADVGGFFTAFNKSFRLMLQSSILGLGAYLVIRSEVTPGVMVASSVLLGRALAPVELLVSQWPQIARASKARRELAALLSRTPPEPRRTALPRPEARLDVQSLTVLPPGQSRAALKTVSFSLGAGQVLGVLGKSGAGKTTLAHALAGLWPAAGGSIRLGSATLEQYGSGALGKLIGYLPQKVHIFDGTIAENISRFAPDAKDADIISAARRAAAHDMITDLPQGYDTRLTPEGGLSGGQMQRIGLARALFGDPVLLILDEPNAHLDTDGTDALHRALTEFKAAGHSVIIMAHRQEGIGSCDRLLMLDKGQLIASGPKPDVLRALAAGQGQLRAVSAPSPAGAP